jgi:hypothetical protein
MYPYVIQSLEFILRPIADIFNFHYKLIQMEFYLNKIFPPSNNFSGHENIQHSQSKIKWKEWIFFCNPILFAVYSGM